jgi:hypothetical protein
MMKSRLLLTLDLPLFSDARFHARCPTGRLVDAKFRGKRSQETG